MLWLELLWINNQLDMLHYKHPLRTFLVTIWPHKINYIVEIVHDLVLIRFNLCWKICPFLYILQVEIKYQVVQVFISYTRNMLLMETNFPLNMDLSLNEAFPALEL